MSSFSLLLCLALLLTQGLHMIHLMKTNSSPGTFHSLGTTSCFPFLLPTGQDMGCLMLCCVLDIPYPKPSPACGRKYSSQNFKSPKGLGTSYDVKRWKIKNQLRYFQSCSRKELTELRLCRILKINVHMYYRG